MKQVRGATMIELTIFLVIMGFIAVSLLMGMNISMEKAPQLTGIVQANLLAQQRMEVIIGYKDVVGFAAFRDPCVAPVLFPDQLCGAGAFASGFTTTTTITPNWSGSSSLKWIEVVVTGTNGKSTLTSVVGNNK